MWNWDQYLKYTVLITFYIPLLNKDERNTVHVKGFLPDILKDRYSEGAFNQLQKVDNKDQKLLR